MEKIDVDIVIGIISATGLISAALAIPIVSYFAERKIKREVKHYREKRNKRQSRYDHSNEQRNLSVKVDQVEQQVISNAKVNARRAARNQQINKEFLWLSECLIWPKIGHGLSL